MTSLIKSKEKKVDITSLFGTIRARLDAIFMCRAVELGMRTGKDNVPFSCPMVLLDFVFQARSVPVEHFCNGGCRVGGRCRFIGAFRLPGGQTNGSAVVAVLPLPICLGSGVRSE